MPIKKKPEKVPVPAELIDPNSDRGLAVCKHVAKMTDTCVLKFSAGKDSLATWLRVREFFPVVVPIFHYWIPDLQFVERALRMYEDFFGTPIIRAPHPNFVNNLANGAYQHPHRWNVIEEYDLPSVDYDDIVEFVCHDLGLKDYWVAVGIKASDSPIRRNTIARNGAWSPKKRLFYPVCDLRIAELRAMFAQAGVSLSDDYRVFGRSFDGLQYRYVAAIKTHYPEDWQTILRWFPNVEAELIRAEAYESEKRRRKAA